MAPCQEGVLLVIRKACDKDDFHRAIDITSIDIGITHLD